MECISKNHDECESVQGAEAILNQLGIPVSVLIDTLYRQIIMTNGIPYSLSVPSLPTRDSMSAAQFDQMMEKGLNQAKAEQGMDLDAAFTQMSERLGGL